ncbi:MAG TPA: UDP-N-acetylmuramoyl-L-alanine--D-glutamate ligase [Acidobacteriota bacterium]|nr:UDP-N-acetylmuramoyl-L-alanine--D-glutamate ligase [Acidobacteriota bacterium]
MTYYGKTVLVVGAARSGIAAAEFLLTQGARVVLTDTRDFEALAPAIAPLQSLAQESGELTLQLGGHKNEDFRNCDLVVVSPGVPLALPFFNESRGAGIPVIAEVELAARHLRGIILGITGSNGKTTTTTLVADLLNAAGLKCRAAGNIGYPLVACISGSMPEDIYATELSSFQLEAIDKFRPFVGSILNLTPDHLDRYSGFEAYIAAKKRLFLNQKASDFAVLNADDPRTLSIAAEVNSRPVLFSRHRELEHGAFVRSGKLFFRDRRGEQALLALSDIALRGDHNLENVLAACAIAILAGAAPACLPEAVRNFPGVEHRLELVAEIAGIQYFNDSKATNVDATIKSLQAFPGNIHLIAGGRDKGGDFTVLRPLVSERVREVVLIGEAAGKIDEALRDVVETSRASSLPEAVFLCSRRARPADVVLLAPACASFDMFQNYEHRGRVFKQAVLELKKASEAGGSL